MQRSEALRLAHAVRDEADRAMQALRRAPAPRPYFLSHLVRDQEIWRLRAKFGDLTLDTHQRMRHCYTDVRVGSYRHDQTQNGGLEDNSKDDESYDYLRLPYGSTLEGLRHGLWKLTDARYREAVDAYLTKQSHKLTYLDPNRHLSNFQKLQRHIDLNWRKFPDANVEHWRRYVTRCSAAVREFPGIMDGHVEIEVRHVVRIHVSTEGSLQLECMPFWRLECYLWLLAESGVSVPWTISCFVTDPEELPKPAALRRTMAKTVDTMRAIAAAPNLRSYAGPVLLDPVPAGLLMHEALGHRLEGNRLLSSGEGQTFRDGIGKPVLPSYLSMRDDPTLERFDGQSLVGHYRFDDEGVPARSAELIERGKLRGFLTSRTCVRRGHRSNGHARSRYHQRPISRMAVTVVDAEHGLNDAALKQALLEEVRRQELPYGIRVMEAHGGETSTENYNFQAFLGETRLVTRVYPDGREEIVRGVDFVGTPLNAVRSIIAAGARQEVDNSFCGAESGFIPVSTISPALLVSHLELQSKAEDHFTQYVYPIPWAVP